MTLLRCSTPIAKKKYRCDAFVWLQEGRFDPKDATEEEQLAIQKTKRNEGRIQIGEKYLYEVSKWNLYDFQVFKANLEIHEICLKYSLYPDEE